MKKATKLVNKVQNLHNLDLFMFCFNFTETEQVQVEDAKEILAGKAYHWKDWCICRGRDCLYIWSDAAALELSNGSNGWFRFILDGKLATMYSSGSPEGGADTSGKKFFIFYLVSFEYGFRFFFCK